MGDILIPEYIHSKRTFIQNSLSSDDSSEEQDRFPRSSYSFNRKFSSKNSGNLNSTAPITRPTIVPESPEESSQAQAGLPSQTKAGVGAASTRLQGTPAQVESQSTRNPETAELPSPLSLLSSRVSTGLDNALDRTTLLPCLGPQVPLITGYSTLPEAVTTTVTTPTVVTDLELELLRARRANLAVQQSRILQLQQIEEERARLEKRETG